MDEQEYQMDPRLQEQRRKRREELRKKRQQRKMIVYAALAVILVLVLVLAIRGCSKKKTADNPNTSDPDQVQTGELEPVVPPEEQTPVAEDAVATLAAVGDVMCYDEQISDASVSGGGYDFTGAFARVKDQLKAADLTVGNLETNFAGTPYSGYPNFSSPPQLAAALADAGFDILQTANTYSLENGFNGLTSTINTLSDAGITAAGTYASRESASENGGVILKEVNGIKFAFIAYTKGVNGRTRPSEYNYCVNLLYTDYTGAYTVVDETALQQSIQSAKALEPDVIVAMLHWGGEYDILPTDSQNSIADLLFRNGVDVILGTHSHVVGPMEKRSVTTVDGETKDVFIAYSLGNFYSSMNRENTQPSALLNLTFTRSGETGKTTISKAEYVPLYIADMGAEAQTQYQVLDIEAEIDRYIGGAEDRVPSEVYTQMRQAVNVLHQNAGDALAKY